MTDFNITDRVDTVLFTDTSANLIPPLAKGISIIPLAYSIEGKEQHQDPQTDFDGHTYYGRIRAGAQVSTSMINPDAFKNAFAKALSQGKDVLYIGMSGGISGTAQAAFCAAAELREQYPERTIITVDTLAASLGEGLQVLKAAQMLNSGSSLASVSEMLESTRHKMCQYFMVDDLIHLRKGGRISGIAARVGTLLGIKPILTGDENGKIVACGKARGRRAALTSLADRYAALAANKGATVGIAHADDPEGAEMLLEMLKERGFCGQDITVCYEPVTGAHVGPGAVALFFEGTHK